MKIFIGILIIILCYFPLSYCQNKIRDDLARRVADEVIRRLDERDRINNDNN